MNEKTAIIQERYKSCPYRCALEGSFKGKGHFGPWPCQTETE